MLEQLKNKIQQTRRMSALCSGDSKIVVRQLQDLRAKGVSIEQIWKIYLDVKARLEQRFEAPLPKLNKSAKGVVETAGWQRMTIVLKGIWTVWADVLGSYPSVSEESMNEARYAFVPFVVDKARVETSWLESSLKIRERQIRGVNLEQDLRTASERGDVVLVEDLLSQGAEVDEPDSVGNTALHYATIQGSIECVGSLVKHDHYVNVRNNDGRAPIHEAASNGNIEVLKYLIESGADKNLFDCYDSTPLHIASGCGHLDIVRELIDIGADVMALNEGYEVPIHLAIKEGHSEIVLYFLQMGFDPNAAISNEEEDEDDQFHEPLLSIAASHGQLQILKILLDRGANIGQTDSYGCNALHEACSSGEVEVVTCLISQGADVNSCANECMDHFTPLHQAISYRHIEIVKILLAKGADPTITISDNMSALEIAESHQLDEIAKLIREYKSR